MTNFRTLVKKMRYAQKEYFKTRETKWLEWSKKLEKAVDKELEDQLNLFTDEK